ncbi:hypothetical protein [Cytophaga aurantiaca]|uniref:hypothetical protein n=1 Tax=Cytophaga aurantiaca TaxID=29530 RepID=UPI00037C8A17|nr:hypothetical protein [Cytophaga aurantiaca]
MKKKINIQNDDGVIELRGSFQDAALYLNKEPIQYTWFAEIGSTWRFHIAKGLPPGTIKENLENQERVKKGILTEEDFYAIVDYYKQFLARGEYEFGYYKLHKHHDWINIPKNDEFKHFDYYGGCPDLIPTQNNIKESWVEFYIEQIKEGTKPAIIILQNEESCLNFILDGHHKFLAYRKANAEPHALIITKLNKSNLSVTEALDLAKKMNCNNEKYINSIKEEKEMELYTMRLDLNKTYQEIEM